MIGRAGRAGLASSGEAIVFCSNDRDESWVRSALSDVRQQSTKPPPVPCLKECGKEILEVVVFENQNTTEFFEKTFRQKKLSPIDISQTISALTNQQLVATVSGLLVPTAIGEALAHSSLPVEEAEQVFAELSAARQNLCLSGGDLHLLFLVTPPVTVADSELELFVQDRPDIFKRPEVCAILGTNLSGFRKKKLLLALVLRDLTSDLSLQQLTQKYPFQSPGTIQYLQTNAATYCAMVVAFCEKLQWVSLAAAIASVKPRLQFGVSQDLLPLVEIEGVSPARAKALAKAGFKTPSDVANSTPLDIAIALTRDVSVEGTQLTRGSSMVELAASMIIQNAKVKCGETVLSDPSFDVSDVPHEFFVPSLSFDLPDAVSPPMNHQDMRFLHQLVGTQIPMTGDISDTDLAEFISPSRGFASPGFSQFVDMIDFIDPPPRVRRISEMTTVDARQTKRVRWEDDETELALLLEDEDPGFP
jgi:DNA polymerase theta